MNKLNKRIEHGIFGYTVPYDSLFESISNYLSKKHNVNYWNELEYVRS